MAESVVSIALETLRDLLLEEGRFLAGVSSQVRTLEAQLKETKALLKDADAKRHKSDTVRCWIKEIRDLAYRAEDAIELYATLQGSSKRGRDRLKQLFRRCSCIFSLHQIGTEISEIQSEIARVTKSMQDYGIRSIIEGESSNDNEQWKRQTFPYESEDVFVGKGKELDELVSLVVDGEEHRVVSLWGMGGIGKTTLARKVYNHHNTKRFFECFAWVCISQRCQIRAVLEDLLKQLNPHNNTSTSNLSDTELIGQLCEIQKSRRCMVVIDDIWKIDHWEGLKHAFLLRDTKSKILLTTRKQDVANIGHAFKAGLLSEDEGWELLKKKAFQHTEVPDFQFEEDWIEKMGREMVGKCGKLPLAISLLGGILNKKKSRREWESVKENMSRYLYIDDYGVENEILGVLNLSYEELPYYLKSCFLDMGRYKEDELIVGEDLCLMWIAHGMISPSRSEEENLMDIAQSYLSELASRCVVEIVADDPIGGQVGRACKLHDVVRELCLSMGKQEDFGLQILDYEGGTFNHLLHQCLSRATKTRHLVVNFLSGLQQESQELIAPCAGDTVRSLHLYNHLKDGRIEFSQSIVDLRKFKLLKDLVFSRIDFVGRKLPREMSNLIHLRNLGLERCKFEELPPSMSNLLYLHTLSLRLSENIGIPDNILNKMTRLKHLILPTYNLEEIGCYKQLRVRLEGVDDLETLVGFNSLVHQLKSLSQMKKLRHFRGTIHDNESLSEIIHSLSTNWKDLRCGGIIIRQGCHLSSDFKTLFTCPNLHDLRIYVRIGKPLKELESQVYASNLVTMFLDGSEIEEDPMGTLGKLPVLKLLSMTNGCFVGEEMTCHAPLFPRLERLVIGDLANLREWRVEEGAMPLVRIIYIDSCPVLEMIPDGFKFLIALTELVILGMPELGKRISEGGEDFHKVKHVPSIFIR